MSPKSAPSTGFTLIELLVSVTVIAVLSGAIIPSFTSFSNSQNLKQASEQVKSDLRSLQGKALAGTLSDVMISGNEVTHWGFRSITDSTIYYFFIATEATDAECANYSQADGHAQGTGSLPSNMSFNSTGCLFFSLADGSTTGTGAYASSNSVIFGYTGSKTNGNCRRVQFNTPGLLYTSSSAAATNCN